MKAEEVPDELVETACRARWDAEGSVFNGHNGDVAYTWDALVALFPTEADTHRRRERAVLAAVLPECGAAVLEEAANDWQTREWANVPRRADRVADRLGAAQYVCDWLRTRAASLITTTEEPTTCLPSLGEPCGVCHRCTEPKEPTT